MDKDSRVRSAAAQALCSYLKGHEHFAAASVPIDCKMRLYNDLVSERIFRSLPSPLSQILDGKKTASTSGGASNVETRFAKVLFRLTNALLNFGDKHLQVGWNRGLNGWILITVWYMPSNCTCFLATCFLA